MDSGSFLADVGIRPLTLSEAGPIEPVGLAIGQGSGGLEVAVTRCPRKPAQDKLREAWKQRRGSRATPVLLVALYDGHAALCGPAGDLPPVFLDLDIGQVASRGSSANGQEGFPPAVAERDSRLDVLVGEVDAAREPLAAVVLAEQPVGRDVVRAVFAVLRSTVRAERVKCVWNGFDMPTNCGLGWRWSAHRWRFRRRLRLVVVADHSFVCCTA